MVCINWNNEFFHYTNFTCSAQLTQYIHLVSHLFPGYKAVQLLDPCLQLCFSDMLGKLPAMNTHLELATTYMYTAI
jgi:hypothetical protein